MIKRYISLLLSLLIIVVSFTACKTEEKAAGDALNNEAATKTEKPSENTSQEVTGHLAKGYDTTPIEIDWYVNLPWFTWGGLEWGEDLVSAKILEKTGVKINFIVPASDGGEQLSTMLATGDLPDIITYDGWWSQESRLLSYQMAKEGYIHPLNDLIDKYAPSMWEVIRDDVFAWHAEEDGKTYLLQNYSYGKKDLDPGEKLAPNGGLVIRKDMWEQIGSPDMSTPEAFLAACEKAQLEIKTYDGQPIVPIQMYEGVGNTVLWLSQYFATPYEDEKGSWAYDFTHENYKDSLKFLNDAYNKGLIIDANFSDNRDLVNEKIASGRVFALIAAPQDFTQALQSLYDKDQEAVYQPVVLKNYKGEDPVLQDIRGMGWLNTAITTNAEHPDRIIQLFEYLLSDEGILDTCFGEEGVTYDWVENGTKIKMTEQYTKDLANDDVKKYGLNSMYLLDNYAARRKWELPPTDPKTLATHPEMTLKAGMEEYSYDFTANSLKVDPADPRLADMTELKMKIDEYRKEIAAQLIVSRSESDFEALYQQAIDHLLDLGLEDLITFNNENFQRAKDALGIERSWGIRN